MEEKNRVRFKGTFIFTRGQWIVPAVFLFALYLDIAVMILDVEKMPESFNLVYKCYQSRIKDICSPSVGLFMLTITIIMSLYAHMHEQRYGISLNEIVSVQMHNFNLHRYLMIAFGNIFLYIYLANFMLATTTTFVVMYELYILLTGCELVRISWLLYNSKPFFINCCAQQFEDEIHKEQFDKQNHFMKDEFMLKKVYLDYHDKPTPEKQLIYENIIEKCMVNKSLKNSDEIIIYRMQTLLTEIIRNIDKENIEQEIRFIENMVKSLSENKKNSPYFLFMITDTLMRQESFIKINNYTIRIIHKIMETECFEEVKVLLFICFYIRIEYGFTYTRKSIKSEVYALDIYLSTQKDVKLFESNESIYQNGYHWLTTVYYPSLSQKAVFQVDDDLHNLKMVKKAQGSYNELFEKLFPFMGN